MQKSIAILLLVILPACQGGLSDSEAEQLTADVDAMKARIAALEAENASLRTQVDANVAELAGAAPTLVGAEELLAAMSVDSNGDVVITNANLWLQSGSGSTSGTVNGKGNLYVGYNEQDRCVGGTNAGAPCGASGGLCAGGTCEPGDGSESLGSHNIVAGGWHTHTSHSGLAVGQANHLEAAECAAVGAGNTCSADRVFLAGEGSTGSAVSCSVLGGLGGACGGAHSVVVGGQSNNTTTAFEVLP